MDESNTPNVPLPAIDQQLVDGVLGQSRRALAKTITLIESTRRDHQLRAHEVLTALLPHTGKAIRVGISGVPGAGKSTFIETRKRETRRRPGRRPVVFGFRRFNPGRQDADGTALSAGKGVHSPQPDSRISRWCRRQNARSDADLRSRRIRCHHCRNRGCRAIAVFVTVSRPATTVAGMVDVFVLLQLPNSGDDLQAIKKGIVEIADMVVFNKADIDERAAECARVQMKTALTMLRSASPNWRPPVLTVSALAKRGIPQFWAEIERYRQAMSTSGEFDEKRRRQAVDWMWSLIDSGLRHFFREHPVVHAALPGLSRDVAEGRTTPGAAAYRLLHSLKN